MRARTLALIYLYRFSPKHSLCLMFAAFRNRFIIHTPILTTVLLLVWVSHKRNQIKWNQKKCRKNKRKRNGKSHLKETSLLIRARFIRAVPKAQKFDFNFTATTKQHRKRAKARYFVVFSLFFFFKFSFDIPVMHVYNVNDQIGNEKKTDLVRAICRKRFASNEK